MSNQLQNFFSTKRSTRLNTAVSVFTVEAAVSSHSAHFCLLLHKHRGCAPQMGPSNEPKKKKKNTERQEESLQQTDNPQRRGHDPRSRCETWSGHSDCGLQERKRKKKMNLVWQINILETIQSDCSIFKWPQWGFGRWKVFQFFSLSSSSSCLLCIITDSLNWIPHGIFWVQFWQVLGDKYYPLWLLTSWAWNEEYKVLKTS